MTNPPIPQYVTDAEMCYGLYSKEANAARAKALHGRWPALYDVTGKYIGPT